MTWRYTHISQVCAAYAFVDHNTYYVVSKQRYNGHAYISKYICFSVNVTRSETLPFGSLDECSDWLSDHLAEVTAQMEIITKHVLHINEQVNAVQKEMECAVLLLCSPWAVQFNALVKPRMSMPVLYSTHKTWGLEQAEVNSRSNNYISLWLHWT